MDNINFTLIKGVQNIYHQNICKYQMLSSIKSEKMGRREVEKKDFDI